MDSKRFAGTAILGALVIVFDYSMKFSGLKIPFPPLPYLKFDFTGIPIVLSLLFFGLTSGATTSSVALLGILARSGDFVGASMKALAEFSTILGIATTQKMLRKTGKLAKASSLILGVTLRCLIMFFANLIILPIYYGTPQIAVIGLSPIVVVFNCIQGTISVILGYFLYSAITSRISSLATEKNQVSSERRKTQMNKSFCLGLISFVALALIDFG